MSPHEVVNIALHWALFALIVSIALGVLTWIAYIIWNEF